ncbi:hypothetical protein GGR53DRAFT_500812 [Hypoxylon sp. FL1150]|nr:hypothetical protein GGR53DRAFT_500812 [Hypoxylon sp. FL1150]
MPNRQQTHERQTSPPRRQRACAPCTKAKARCHFETNKVDDGCDRCRRMNIDCTPQTTRSLRRPRQVKLARSGPIPEKQGNDRISSFRAPNYGHILLGAGPFGLSNNGNSPESTTSSPTRSVTTESPSGNGIGVNTGRENHQPPPEQNHLYLARPQQTLPSLSVNKPPQPGFGIPWGQAEQAVLDFRVNFTPFFPFVALDPDVTAQELLSKKPLLFRAIMLAAAQLTLAKQKEIKRSMLAYIGQHLLVMEERDLGLLQGLLVFIAWGEHGFYFDQKITYLTYLAMGYAHNIAITRPPPTMKQKMTVVIHPKDAHEAIQAHNLTTVLEESHTPEEQRAFLGCQYLLSVNSSQFGRGGVLKEGYIDRCLDSLMRPTDFGADFILDKMVRFQQIVEQISEKLPSPKQVDNPGTFTISLSNEMQSIRDQLNQLFANMAREHRQFVLFWALHNYVLVRLYLPASYLSPPSDAVAAEYQLQCILYCLQAARSFFATILSIGQEGFLFRSFTSYHEILFVLVAASRLLLVEIDGWDLDEARRIFDFPSILESIISTFKGIINLRNKRATEAAATYGVSLTPDNVGDEKDDRWFKYAIKLEWIKNWFEAQLSGGFGIPGDPDAENGPVNWSQENQTLSPFMFGFLGDDNWNMEF